MKTRRITTFVCALATVVLIAGLPPWDHIQRSATPQTEDFHGRISLTTDVLVLSGLRITQEKLGCTKVGNSLLTLSGRRFMT